MQQARVFVNLGQHLQPRLNWSLTLLGITCIGYGLAHKYHPSLIFENRAEGKFRVGSHKSKERYSLVQRRIN